MKCTAVLKPLGEVDNLEALWTDFERRAFRPFFLSWNWLDVAACHGADQIFIALISNSAGDLVGLGWFCALEEVRHSIMPVKQLRLHEVGEDGAATVPAEFNSLMTLQGYDTDAWEALLAAVFSSDCPPWDEIVLTNAYTKVQDFFAAQKLRTHRRAEHMSAFVNLEKLRVDGAVGIEGYLQHLSRNTRSQIRRSIRLYEERGPITLDRASTPREAHKYLTTLACLHEEKWRARGSAGLMSNEQYLAFNRTMIDRHFASGVIELLCVRAGNEAIGLVCNFVDRGRVLFNVGGFASSSDNRVKPGMVTQALAIADHMDRGNIVYDFMAGNDRYKYSLGERGPDMIQFAIQKPTPFIILEAAARFAKQKIVSLSRIEPALEKNGENTT
ncbi:MAG: GNAT family N-acetyltransferase [Marinicaulis sp.]|nr:GNAT family N-acetyltransferase [Marinicaulis sp.]NNE41291.1 GNAT family N-acetyltransferase [Marinicaulis sp.]